MILNKIISTFLTRNLGVQKAMGLTYLKCSKKEKKLLTKNPIYTKTSKVREKFPDKQKLRKFISTKAALEETLSGVLQGEMKGPSTVTQSHMEK